MYQVPIAYAGENQLRAELRALAADERVRGASAVLVTLYTDTVDVELVEGALAVLREELPQALWCGCSMNAGIESGMLDDSHALMFCTVFEDPSTRLDLLQHGFGEGEMARAAEEIVAEAAARPWAKAIVLLATSGSADIAPFCEKLSGLSAGIRVAGGVACDRYISDDAGYVFSSAGEVSNSSVVALIVGGPELQVETARVSGWQPLGRELRITRCEGEVIDEFNGEPAFDVYSHYLKIDSGSGFYSNALEFPLLFEAEDGMQIPLVPVRAGRKGELQLVTSVENGDVAHIAYGDPDSIRREVEGAANELYDQASQGIVAFDCASRRKFWGDEDCSGETVVFDSIAPTMGFYTGGEFYRAPSGQVHFNNTSLVLVGLREGRVTPAEESQRPPVALRGTWVRRRLSVVHRMANFVNVAVADLEKANEQLRELASADPLTGLLNRGEIQRRIERTLGEAARKAFPVSLLMLDIDDYKQVNDEFGHQRGDSLLRSFARIMGDIVGVMAPGASVGRWGGDEFMILLPGTDLYRGREIAEAVRRAFAAIDLGAGGVSGSGAGGPGTGGMGAAGAQTVSVGVAQWQRGETADALCRRVDERLYEAKREGKNRVCS